MSIDHLEIIVEEPSMEMALRALVPKLLGAVSFRIYVHQGKADLLKHLPSRLRGYANFLPSSWRILVLVDRDDEDCVELKNRLEMAAQSASLLTRSSALVPGVYKVVNRIAIEELEAWYFGDWEAARTAYPKLSPNIPAKATYRFPDRIAGGTWESFQRVAQDAGYFKTGLRKIEAAQKIAPYLDPARSASPSFRALCSVLSELSTKP